MGLPPLAPIPPSTIRLSIAPEEWQACLESWLTLSDLHLRQPSRELKEAYSEKGSLVQFLRSFYHEKAHTGTADTSLHSESAHRLLTICFKLVHRLIIEVDLAGSPMLDFEFLADLCHLHARSAALSRLMSELWKRNAKAMEKLLGAKKLAILTTLGLSSRQEVLDDLRQVATLMRASPDAAFLFMTGSDFLDALVSYYDEHSSTEQRKAVVYTAFFGLVALVQTEAPNISLLSDHLYSLKAQADQTEEGPTLLADLVTSTPLISKLRRTTVGSTIGRLPKLLEMLKTYRTPNIAHTRKHIRRRGSKGKSKATQVNGGMHMHRMSLVTQIQDLFPDLGSGFILKLLDEYDESVEQVTAHLLDDSLPASLRDSDRAEQAPIFDETQQGQVASLEPRSTPPPQSAFIPERRNVFDDDEFDRLEIDSARLRLGKKKDMPSEGQPNKAAILSALAAFDADDDERDDTYDVEDVGGTVDSAHPDGEPGPSAKVAQEENDMALFATYKTSPELFGRTFDVRRGQARQALKAETGMTDEAIEGWAIMLQRDPKRLKRLEAQSGSFDGRQGDLVRTAYRESPAGTETEDSDVPGGRGGYRGSNRGRGRGGRGRGGNVAGPAGEAGTAAAQRRKEASKGSRANHNRRDQRARKMARGGFAG